MPAAHLEDAALGGLGHAPGVVLNDARQINQYHGAKARAPQIKCQRLIADHSAVWISANADSAQKTHSTVDHLSRTLDAGQHALLNGAAQLFEVVFALEVKDAVVALHLASMLQALGERDLRVGGWESGG